MDPPAKFRFFVALVAFLGGYALCFWGWPNIYNNRRVRGVLLLILGQILGLSGLTLLWLTPSTWKWWP